MGLGRCGLIEHVTPSSGFVSRLMVELLKYFGGVVYSFTSIFGVAFGVVAIVGLREFVSVVAAVESRCS